MNFILGFKRSISVGFLYGDTDFIPFMPAYTVQLIFILPDVCLESLYSLEISGCQWIAHRLSITFSLTFAIRPGYLFFFLYFFVLLYTFIPLAHNYVFVMYYLFTHTPHTLSISLCVIFIFSSSGILVFHDSKPCNINRKILLLRKLDFYFRGKLGILKRTVQFPESVPAHPLPPQLSAQLSSHLLFRCSSAPVLMYVPHSWPSSLNSKHPSST